MFYIVCKDIEQRSNIINKLKEDNIYAVFHYLSLHKSPFYCNKHDGRILQSSDSFSECLIRLPMFYDLDIMPVVNSLLEI